jgi:hypothetical protein
VRNRGQNGSGGHRRHRRRHALSLVVQRIACCAPGGRPRTKNAERKPPNGARAPGWIKRPAWRVDNWAFCWKRSGGTPRKTGRIF